MIDRLWRLGLLLALSVTALGWPAPAAAHPEPMTCEGYTEKRVFVESQSWWTRTPGENGTDHGHVHTGTCFPLHQQVSGVVPLNVRVVMHNNPGKLTRLRMYISSVDRQVVVADKRFDPPLTCAGTCEWWVHLEADTTKVAYDGRQEWRLRAYVDEPDGARMAGSTGWQTYLANGKPIKDYRRTDIVEGKGWYTDASYARAYLDEGFTMAPVGTSWTIKYHCDSSGPALSECLVTVDPNFHMGNDGTVLVRDTSGSTSRRSLTIDTTQFGPGMHRLVIRSSAEHESGSTNGGVLVIPFVVP